MSEIKTCVKCEHSICKFGCKHNEYFEPIKEDREMEVSRTTCEGCKYIDYNKNNCFDKVGICNQYEKYEPKEKGFVDVSEYYQPDKEEDDD